MNKREFLTKLRAALRGLPKYEIEERLNFYGEMIDDRLEEGYSERSAVSQIGTVAVIASEIRAEFRHNHTKAPCEEPKRRPNAWKILLIVLGSPIWLCLLIAFAAVVISLYAALIAVVISLWSALLSLAVCAPAGIILSVFFLVSADTLSSAFTFGATLAVCGIAILFFYGCKAATIGTLLLGKKMAIWVKNCFVKGERA